MNTKAPSPEEVSLSMVSCCQGYVSEVIGSIEFSCGELSDEQAEKIANAVFTLVEEAAKKYEEGNK